VRSIALGLLWLPLAGCVSHGAAATPAPPDHAVVITIGGGSVRLDVGVADTDPERERGLMGVTSLPADQGMAFVFAEPTRATFWMKDTVIPLAIAFVDVNRRVVTIEEMEPCHTNPCPTYQSSAPYTMAVEANAGWFDRAGVAVGDRAELEPIGA
jgi:uncharacterized membrane protein (UPF0127 family)